MRCDFFCHWQGKQPLKIVDPSKEQRNRKSLKCECKAHLSIILWKLFDIFPQEWHVTKFVVDHNHDLFSPSEVRFLLANQVITIDDKKCIFLLKEAGLSIREVMSAMELKRHLKHGQLPFFQMNIRNLYVKGGGRMQRMMPWIFYNFAKLLKKRILDSNMHLQPMKKKDWSIFSVTYSLFWLVPKIWRCGCFLYHL